MFIQGVDTKCYGQEVVLSFVLLNSMALVKGNLFYLQDLDLKSLIIEAYFKGQQVYETF